MKLQALLAGAAVAVVPGLAPATTVVFDFEPGSPWQQTLQAGDGTVEVVDLTGAGGNLEANAPLPTGAVRFATTDDNADRAEIAADADYGDVSRIFTDDLSFAYSVYKQDTGENFGAPSMKLHFFNPDVTTTGDDRGFVQLIFEPNWNQPGAAGSSSVVPSGDWVDYSFTLDEGLLWSTQGFGTPNSAGGPPLNTLEGWRDTFNEEFFGATLFRVSIGLGSFNPNNVAYVDNVRIGGTFADATFDFETFDETGVIPLPAALPLLAGGLGVLGLMGWRRRRSAA